MLELAKLVEASQIFENWGNLEFLIENDPKIFVHQECFVKLQNWLNQTKNLDSDIPRLVALHGLFHLYLIKQLAAYFYQIRPVVGFRGILLFYTENLDQKGNALF